jgi:hypothetical protein
VLIPGRKFIGITDEIKLEKAGFYFFTILKSAFTAEYGTIKTGNAATF